MTFHLTYFKWWGVLLFYFTVLPLYTVLYINFKHINIIVIGNNRIFNTESLKLIRIQYDYLFPISIGVVHFFFLQRDMSIN